MRNFLLIIFLAIIKYSFASDKIPADQSISKLNENLFYFNRDNHYGLVDSSRNIIKEPVYDNIQPFSKGNFAVFQGDVAGLVDSNGEIIFPVKFSNMMDGEYDEDRKIDLIDTLGLKCEYDTDTKSINYIKKGPYYIKVTYKTCYDINSYCLADSNGICISDNFNEIGEFTCGKALAKIGSKVGYLDLNGKFTEEPLFNDLYFSYNKNGYIIMYSEFKNENHKFDCLLDSCHNMTIPFYYDNLNFEGDYIRAEKNGKSGIITYKNDVVIPLEYDTLEPLSNDLDNPVYLAKKDGLYGLITHNKVIAPFIYTKILKLDYRDYYNEELFGICDGGTTSYHLDCFKTITLPSFQAITKDSSYYILSDKGDVMIEGKVWDIENSGNIVFKNDDKLGIIKSNKVIIPVKYTQLTKRYEYIGKNENQFQFYEVHDDKLVGIFSINGECLVPPVYANVEFQENNDYEYKNELPRFQVEDTLGKKGIYNINGKNLVPVKFDDIIYSIDHTKEWFEVGKRQSEDLYYKGIYDINGNCIVPVTYENVELVLYDDDDNFSNAWFYVEKGGKKGAYTFKGDPILKVKYKKDIFEKVKKKMLKK